MKEDLIDIKNEAIAKILSASTVEALAEITTEYLGKKGRIRSVIKQIASLPTDEKKGFGLMLNQVKSAIEEAILDAKNRVIENVVTNSVFFDPTIPGLAPDVGHLHPQTRVLQEITAIFTYLGYQVTDGPEIETDYYNFEALNFPKDHPARDTQQTLFVKSDNSRYKFGELLLRTQTSAMQGRIMEKAKPPFRVLVPGRNFRYEQVDASHGFEFWQVEGFVVDKNIHLTDLFGTIDFVLKKLFGASIKIRFATTNFPFVEPGVDTYLACSVCGGKGCSFCKKTGWSEIMPAGMIHPNVLKQAGIDNKVWNGFAFAIGLSRVVSLRYKIPGLRLLTTPDTRIVSQFN